MEGFFKQTGRALGVFRWVGVLVLAAPLSDFAATTIGLAWDSAPDPNVVGYNLYYGTASRRYTRLIPTGPATGVTISGLSQGSTYYFAVTALDALGLETVPSVEVSYAVPRPTTGTYTGLFIQDTGAGQSTAGYFVISVTALGSYSGQIVLGSERYSISGQLNPQGQVIQIIRRPGERPLAIAFTVGTDQQAGEIVGQVTDGTWISNLTADRATFNARTNAAPFAGNYTLVLQNQDNNPTVPDGIGYGTLRVDTGGRALFAGALADGTKLSRSATVSKDGIWPLFVPLYAGQGLMISRVAITNQPDSDLHGDLDWIKPPTRKARFDPGGFTNRCEAIGSIYIRPADITTSILKLTYAEVMFGGGNFSGDFTNSVRFLLNSFVDNLSPNKLAMGFSLSSGTFKGHVADPGTGRSMSFGGVAMQKLGAGYGFLLGTNRSSQVVIGP